MYDYYVRRERERERDMREILYMHISFILYQDKIIGTIK